MTAIQTPTRRTLFVRGPGNLILESRPVPVPGVNDVVVRVEACGICGSDLNYAAAGGMPTAPGEPMALGHEFAGRVEAMGANVAGVTLGMRVIVNPDDNLIGAGADEGGFSDRILVRNARVGGNLLRLPDHLPPERGALVEPLSVGLHGVNRARVGPGSKVVVFGAGMIGMGAVIGLKNRGIEDIAVVDLNDERLELARHFGAKATINPGRGEDLETVLSTAHGRTTRYGWSVVDTDAFIDTAGAPVLLDRALAICKGGARVVVIALHHKPYTLDLVNVMAKEIEILGSCTYPQDEFAEVLEMLASGVPDPSPLITHRFGFNQIMEAFAAAKDPRLALKVMVNFEEATA
ncbi:MAG: zinc-binding dehydrogenase [Proteobacteria bacterium]|nr:zinc-binding dehydrogenase [Pseudomonadota bacterium]HQR02977.1 zinc-binding dehydrogenase [Rhodocyclaceae bacterium]